MDNDEGDFGHFNFENLVDGSDMRNSDVVLYWWKVLKKDEELLHFTLAVLPEETQLSSSDDSTPPVVRASIPTSERKRKKIDDTNSLKQYRLNMQRNTESIGKSLESSAKSMRLSAYACCSPEGSLCSQSQEIRTQKTTLL